jgi:hypothetical protein
MLFFTSKLYHVQYVVHVVNYNMSKFGFKIIKLLNLKWKIASSITNLILISGHCTYLTSK